MCNQACLSFVEKCLKPDDISGKFILEIGSLDVNGSARYYVEKHEPAMYLGTDIVKGKGVDEICDVRHLVKKYGTEKFDIVICTEVLEHVQDWKAAIENMISVLRIGGKLIITTRSPGFPIHNWPDDFWRFTRKNFVEIFSNLDNAIVEDDPDNGVLFCGIKGDKMKIIPDVKLETPIPFDLVIGHCSFIPHTGYASHSREFFTRLADYLPVRIRNFAYTPDLSHLSEKQKNMVIHQTWTQPPYQLGLQFNRDFYHKIINIVLMETNHYYFYDKYDGPKVAYNVWESTRQPEQFFFKLLEYDMMWVPTNWQRWCTIEQGYPADKIFVVPEGVNEKLFNPGEPPIKVLKDDRFKFLVCGRWDYRKSTTEILRAFIEEFKKDEPVDIVCQIENPFRQDEYGSTQERLVGHKLVDPRIKIVTGLPESDDLYLSYLRSCHCLVTCARSEGWNLPLIQGIATGIPTIASNWGAQLEFCKDISRLVNIKEMKKPENVFMQKDTPGEWAEPDFDHLKQVMREVYENYEENKKIALEKSEIVRRDFTWEKAVEKSVEILREFGSGKAKGTKKIELKKLNLGCGDALKPGYLNADKYDRRAEVNFDAKEIPYEDETFDEVYSSHLLEHFNKFDVPIVLSECYRVLKYDGKLVFEVPDFEWALKTFLGKPENEKWDFHIDTIFGLQINEGEQHKIGFTRKKLEGLLYAAGFKDIKMKDVWSHDQQCIIVEAVKKIPKEIFIVDTYPDLPEKEELTKGMIEEIKERGYPVVLVSHYPVSPEIQKMVDYYVYDVNNILSEGWNLNYWFQNEDVKIISQYETKYHGAACYSSLVNAVRLISQYDIAHFIEFDIDADLDLYLDEAGKQLEKYRMVGFIYDEEQNPRKIPGVQSTYGIIANLFSFDVKWMNGVLKDISSWSDYNKLVAEASSKTRIKIDLIFENWLYNYFKANSEPNDIFLFTKDDLKNKIIKNRNLFDQGKKEPIERTFLSETADGRAVEFTVNTETRKWSYKIVDREKDKDYSKANFKFKDGRLICKRWNSFDDVGWIEKEDLIKITYLDGVKVEIIGSGNDEYNVTFVDRDVNLIVHKGKIKPNHWIAPNARYYVNWKIIVDKNGQPYKEFEPDFAKSKVLVYFDSKALGDTLAWFPYAKVFKEKHGCEDFYVSTFWNKIFEKEYPDLRFVEPGSLKPDIYYNVGCRDNDYHSNKNNWRLVPLQKVATDFLGLDYEEIKPRVTAEKKNVKKQYVTISEHSTLLCKRWHYPLGWQVVVDYIKDKGYDVMVVSKEPTQLTGIVDRTNATIQQTINNIYNSKLFIGVGSGLSWLAWALNVPVILISGFSEPWSEMQDCIRIIPPEGMCRGCYNDIKHPYDRGNWLWCPRNKKYECSRTIKPEVIIEQIDKNL